MPLLKLAPPSGAQLFGCRIWRRTQRAIQILGGVDLHSAIKLHREREVAPNRGPIGANGSPVPLT